MKSTLKLTLVLSAAVAAIIVGCATKNPSYTPIAVGQPETNTVPQWIVDPRINNYSNTVAGAASIAAPLNPYAGLTTWAISGVFGIWGALATYVAKNKNGALNAMGAAVVQSGAHPVVLDAAGNSPHFTAIADSINSNLGVNQSLGSTPPKV